jgi:hypothetical protein
MDDLRSTLGTYLVEGHFAKLIHEVKTASTVRVVYSCLEQLGLVKESIVPIEKGLKDFNSIKFRPLLLLLAYILKHNPSE